MEKWRDIPGYEGIYQVSDIGRIRTCEGKTTYTKRHGIRHWKQRIIKQKITNSRYARKDARVNLWKDGKEKTWLVSRLVGFAWCAGYADGMTINHINGNSLDNRAKNLEWLSVGDNIRHAFSNNLMHCQTPVFLVCQDDISEFRSMAEASRFIGRNDGYVSGQIKRGNRITGADGKEYAVRM